jgi:hypothetical protein
MRKKSNRRIIREIEKWVGKNSFLFKVYGKWYVGITNSPYRRKQQHSSNHFWGIGKWKYWKAASIKQSRSIEKYFSKKGMTGGKVLGGAKRNSVYIYVYKI